MQNKKDDKKCDLIVIEFMLIDFEFFFDLFGVTKCATNTTTVVMAIKKISVMESFYAVATIPNEGSVMTTECNQGDWGL